MQHVGAGAVYWIVIAGAGYRGWPLHVSAGAAYWIVIAGAGYRGWPLHVGAGAENRFRLLLLLLLWIIVYC